MADLTTKNAWQQPQEDPLGTIADENMVLAYGDPDGNKNMLNIKFTSLILWIWKKLTFLNTRGEGDFVLTNNDSFASLSDKSAARNNINAKYKYRIFKRDFTSSGGDSTSTATLISTPVTYDVILIQHNDWFRLPLRSDDPTLVDGQELTIQRVSMSGNPAIRYNELYGYGNQVLHQTYSSMKFIYDYSADRWRLESIVDNT